MMSARKQWQFNRYQFKGSLCRTVRLLKYNIGVAELSKEESSVMNGVLIYLETLINTHNETTDMLRKKK